MQEHRYAAVLLFVQHIVHRQIGGRPVVLRPVELDAAGDPGAGKPYQGRLYYMIIVYTFSAQIAALFIFAFLRPWFFQIASILLQTIKPLNRINCCLI